MRDKHTDPWRTIAQVNDVASDSVQIDIAGDHIITQQYYGGDPKQMPDGRIRATRMVDIDIEREKVASSFDVSFSDGDRAVVMVVPLP